MRKLHLVGFTSDRKGLIFSARRGSKSGGFLVAVEDSLLESLDAEQRRRDGTEIEPSQADAARPAAEPQPVGRPQSTLTPREMQARLRAGRTIAEVAAEAHVAPDWVARFAVPILAEQAQMVELARSLTYVKPRGGESAAPLGPSVAENLAERGVLLPDDLFDAAWSAFQLHDVVWIVRVRYRSRGRLQEAAWEVDVASGQLNSRNRLASELGYVEKGRRRAPARMPVSPDPDVEALPEPPRRRSRPRTGTTVGGRSAASTRAGGGTRRRATGRSRPSAAKAPARKAPARKAPARKAPARKAPARKAPARKTTAAKAAGKAAVPTGTTGTTGKVARKAGTSTARPRKAAPGKAAPRKAAPRKAAPRKASPKAVTPKSTAAGRAVTRKAPAPKAVARRTPAPKAAAPKIVAPKTAARGAPAATRKGREAPATKAGASKAGATEAGAAGGGAPALPGTARSTGGGRSLSATSAASAARPVRLPRVGTDGTPPAPQGHRGPGGSTSSADVGDAGRSSAEQARRTLNRLASRRVAANRAEASRLAGDRRAANPPVPPVPAPARPAPSRTPASEARATTHDRVLPTAAPRPVDTRPAPSPEPGPSTAASPRPPIAVPPSEPRESAPPRSSLESDPVDQAEASGVQAKSADDDFELDDLLEPTGSDRSEHGRPVIAAERAGSLGDTARSSRRPAGSGPLSPWPVGTG